MSRPGEEAAMQELVEVTEDLGLYDPRPPGEPRAERLADELADVVVVDGPHRGSVWSYEASHGGYMRTDPRGRAADGTICTDVAALLAHTGAQVVRPLPRREA